MNPETREEPTCLELEARIYKTKWARRSQLHKKDAIRKELKKLISKTHFAQESSAFIFLVRPVRVDDNVRYLVLLNIFVLGTHPG